MGGAGLRMGETITHEKAYAASHRGSTTQQLQGQDDDYPSLPSQILTEAEKPIASKVGF
jgi:hypothetical protein